MTLQNSKIRDELQDLTFKVLALVPDHRDPERYHLNKSEIVGRLKALSRRVEHGRVAL